MFTSQKIFLSIFFISLITGCGSPFEVNSKDEDSLILAPGEVLVGDMILSEDLLVESGWSEEDIHAAISETRNQGFTYSNSLIRDQDEIEASGVAKYHKRWVSGIIPVTFASGITQSEKNHFFNQCATLGQRARIRCENYNSNRHGRAYIRVIKGGNPCGASYLGRVGGGRQDLWVHSSCWFDSRTIKHELMHALGVSHEHQHPDRNRFLTINKENIIDGMHYNFNIIRIGDAREVTGFDINSIMLYHSWTFSKNEQKTIERKNSSDPIYRNMSMSNKDHRILQQLYGSW